MKLKNLIVLLAFGMLCSFTDSHKPNYLFLKSNQLNALGIHILKEGVFYKNYNTNWKQDNSLKSCLSFYSTEDIYLNTRTYNKSEKIDVRNKYDKILNKLETSNNDFYPLLIGNMDGRYSLDNGTLPEDMNLFPIAIDLSEINLPGRSDTLLMWFKPSEALKNALPEGVNMDDYLSSNWRR